MTMHEHNTDLIMALAEGRLEAEQTLGAEADISDCAQCSEDLSLQRRAIAALSAAPAVAMNDLERARLHRAVRDELGLGTASATSTAGARTSVRDSRRFRLFTGLAGAAAVLIAFVVIVPGLTTGGDDASATTTAASGGLTAAQELPPREVSEFSDSRESLDATVDEVGDGGIATESGAPTTAVASATTAAPAATGDDAVPPFIYWSALELEQFPDLAALRLELLDARSIEDVFGPPNEEAATRIGELNTELCRTTGVARAPDATEAFIVGISGINDVEVVIIAYVTGDFDDVTVLAHDLETCKVMPTP